MVETGPAGGPRERQVGGGAASVAAVGSGEGRGTAVVGADGAGS